MSNPIPMNPTAGTPEGGELKAKKGFIAKVIDGAKKAYDTVNTNKFGHAAIKVVKGAAIGLGLYGAYKKGQKSVKPVTVYISEGTTEDEELQAEEPAVEETNDETVEETAEV